MIIVGTNAVGTLTSESPYEPKEYLAYPSMIPGFSIIGDITSSIASGMYSVKVVMRQQHSHVYTTTSFVRIFWDQLYKARAYTFTPNYETTYGCKALTTLPYRLIYSAISTLRERQNTFIGVSSLLVLPHATFYAIKTFTQAYYANIYATKVLLRKQFYDGYVVKVTLRQATLALYATIATLRLPAKGIYKVRALLTKPYKYEYKVTAVLRERYNAMYKVQAGLANTMGHWYHGVKVKLNVAPLASSLRKRTQEILTKAGEWF